MAIFRTLIGLSSWLLVGLWLSGCTPQLLVKSQPYTPAPATADPEVEYASSYEVYGQRYYVLADATGYSERGIASWYGPNFHGKPTANGETYDMHGLTAAHKTLPLPSYVQVKNLENGREIILRINDRGPFVGERIIDLSFAAATELDMIEQGTAQVEVSVLSPEAIDLVTGGSDASLVGSRFVIQMASFRQRARAEHYQSILQQKTHHPVTLAASQDQSPVYRIQVGPFTTPARALAVASQLRLPELGEPLIVTE